MNEGQELIIPAKPGQKEPVISVSHRYPFKDSRADIVVRANVELAEFMSGLAARHDLTHAEQLLILNQQSGWIVSLAVSKERESQNEVEAADVLLASLSKTMEAHTHGH